MRYIEASLTESIIVLGTYGLIAVLLILGLLRVIEMFLGE